MTSNTAQAMIDLVHVLRGGRDLSPVRARLRAMSLNIAAFGVGCAVAALLMNYIHTWCFVVPPMLALASLRTKPRL